MQDGSIYILNVTFNDTGTYRCFFNRVLSFPNYEFHTNITKSVEMKVVPRGEWQRSVTGVLERSVTGV